MTHNKGSDDTTVGRRRVGHRGAGSRGGAAQRGSIVASVAEIVAAYPEATEALLSDAVKRRPDEALRIVVACIKANPSSAAEVLRIVRESPFLKAKVTMDNLMGVLLPDLLDLERAETRQEQAAAASGEAEPAEEAPRQQPDAAAPAEPPDSPKQPKSLVDDHWVPSDEFTEPVVAALRRAREAALMNRELQEIIEESRAEKDEDEESADRPPLLEATPGRAAWEIPSEMLVPDEPLSEPPTIEPTRAEEPKSEERSADEPVSDEAARPETPAPDEADGTVLRLYPEFDEADFDEPGDDSIEFEGPDFDEPSLEEAVFGDEEAVVAAARDPDPAPERPTATPMAAAVEPESVSPESAELTFSDYLSGGVPRHAPLILSGFEDQQPGPSELGPAGLRREERSEAPAESDASEPARGPVPVPPRAVTVIGPAEAGNTLTASKMKQAVLRLEGFPSQASLWGLVTDSGSFELVLRLPEGADRVAARIDDLVRHPDALAEVEFADRKLNLQDLIIGVDLFRPGGPEDPGSSPEPERAAEDGVVDIRPFDRAASDYRGRGELDA